MGLFVESERQIDAPDDPRVSPDDTEPGKGSIVNISAIAADFVSRGIRCNCICSGNVDARTRRDRQPSWTSAVYLPSTDGAARIRGGNCSTRRPCIEAKPRRSEHMDRIIDE